MKRTSFPLTIKRGSSTVKIYRDAKASGNYYRVVYYLGGKRHRLNFHNIETAINEAEAKAAQLSRGDIDAAQLSGRDRIIYGRALDAVKPTGLPLNAAALEYAEARKILDNFSLLDAVRFYIRHQGKSIKRVPVADAVDEMIETKKVSGVSELYLADLRYRLGVFKKRFQCDLVSLTPDDARNFFADLGLGARSFNNFASTLKTFLRFAQDRGWLSKESDLLASVHRRKPKATPVDIFTPRELSVVLTHASHDLAICLAIAAFTGLRSEEILRLDWSDLRRRPNFVEVGAHKAKTATRRLVPIPHNLAQWIATAGNRVGAVWQRSKTAYFDAIRDNARRAKIAWRQNALRHSWITYRLADIQDVNRVALEAGNSPQMIFRHYRELATPQQARSWFSIIPDEATNVLAMATRKVASA